ncbi:MAG: MBOAT family protein [Chloroflexi bacterium]|nr:MBOAT family protein [Chloroflexota bacterium]
MSFSTITFLFGFLGLFLAIYHAVPRRFIKTRNVFTLLASYLFYLWGAPGFVPILLLSTVADYLLGLLIATTKHKNLFLSIAVGQNLGLLVLFKYTGFLLGEISKLFTVFGFDSLVWTQIALPLGISFFTFQKISYLVDVYRGTSPPQRDFIAFALYVALFPKLVAGPIVQYHQIADQFIAREDTIRGFYEGVLRFCYGLGKKVLIADTIGTIADRVFQIPPAGLTMPVAWLGILCYTFQIYFDFAGYSDMAIGVGRMIGFNFPENFNFPYISSSIQEFWRRWHMSLTGWLRNYLYIPLGGNRVSKVRNYFNLWIVFLFTGLWHGANWTFLFWGIFHGSLLTIQRLVPSALTGRIPKLFAIAGTFILVLIGWVFFRSNTISDAFAYILTLGDFRTFFSTQDIPFLINNKQWVFLGLAAVFSFCPYWTERLKFNQKGNDTSHFIDYIRGFVAIIILIYSIIVLSGATYNPFIYQGF